MQAVKGWKHWHDYFRQRAGRPLPELDLATDYSALPDSLADSLAVFQLGESGGGTVITQARVSRLPGVDADYAGAIEYFVAEEHRHANILAMCVRMLGGCLRRSNWTARLFVIGRRMMGLRLKVLVLLAAEVVGICYYRAIASALPASPLRTWLMQIVDDERTHLEFHCAFLRSQLRGPLHRAVFMAAWRSVMVVAAVVVMLDHRRTIRDLGLGFRRSWHRWMAIGALAEQLVTGPAGQSGAGRPGDSATRARASSG